MTSENLNGVIELGNKNLKCLIYPLPDKIGLGIHTVLQLDGSVSFGPNAYYVDKIGYDTNSNEKLDFFKIDINEDEKIDLYGFDDNEDGNIDRYSQR